MIALKLTRPKNFMSHLLLSETFDHFLLIEGEITTFNTFHIDGYMQKEFFESPEGLPEYSPWKQTREFCHSLIRGKRTPLAFKFIFSLSAENIARFIESGHLDFKPDDVQGLYMNIRFDENGLNCVTGTSLKTFSMDKSLEKGWDAMVQRFFTKKDIEYDVVA